MHDKAENMGMLGNPRESDIFFFHICSWFSYASPKQLGDRGGRSDIAVQAACMIPRPQEAGVEHKPRRVSASYRGHGSSPNRCLRV